MSAARFDLAAGFAFEEPAVLVPWTVTQNQLLALFAPRGQLRRMSPDYFHLSGATALSGMSCSASFQFHPDAPDRLVNIRLYRKGLLRDQSASWEEWQGHLEETLGPPHKRWRSDTGFDGCLWKAGRAELVHDVIDRFGLEETVLARAP